MYWICAIVSLISILLLLPIPETNGLDLSDKIDVTTEIHSSKETSGCKEMKNGREEQL